MRLLMCEAILVFVTFSGVIANYALKKEPNIIVNNCPTRCDYVQFIIFL